MIEEEYNNILQEKFANVGLNYSDNFFGNMVFHTLFCNKRWQRSF